MMILSSRDRSGNNFLLFVYWNYDVFFLKNIKLGRPFPHTVVTQTGAAKADNEFHCNATVNIYIPLLMIEFLVEK